MTIEHRLDRHVLAIRCAGKAGRRGAHGRERAGGERGSALGACRHLPADGHALVVWGFGRSSCTARWLDRGGEPLTEPLDPGLCNARPLVPLPDGPFLIGRDGTLVEQDDTGAGCTFRWYPQLFR